jgi:hypothetical protein
MQANINMQILRTAQFSVSRPRRLVVRAEQSNNNERKNYNVRKGKQFENKKRRRGRPVSSCCAVSSSQGCFGLISVSTKSLFVSRLRNACSEVAKHVLCGGLARL